LNKFAKIILLSPSERWNLSVNCESALANCLLRSFSSASLAQLAEHALRKRAVAGSIPAVGFIYVIAMTTLTCEAIFLKTAHICIHFTDARNTADVIENLMVLERQKNITRISMTPLEFVEPQMARSVCICLRVSIINKMTRPGLEPGISGSGGRRLIHKANGPLY
jgi:hypothetical protein